MIVESSAVLGVVRNLVARLKTVAGDEKRTGGDGLLTEVNRVNGVVVCRTVGQSQTNLSTTIKVDSVVFRCRRNVGQTICKLRRQEFHRNTKRVRCRDCSVESTNQIKLIHEGVNAKHLHLLIVHLNDVIDREDVYVLRQTDACRESSSGTDISELCRDTNSDTGHRDLMDTLHLDMICRTDIRNLDERVVAQVMRQRSDTCHHTVREDELYVFNFKARGLNLKHLWSNDPIYSGDSTKSIGTNVVEDQVVIDIVSFTTFNNFDRVNRTLLSRKDS